MLDREVGHVASHNINFMHALKAQNCCPAKTVLFLLNSEKQIPTYDLYIMFIPLNLFIVFPKVNLQTSGSQNFFPIPPLTNPSAVNPHQQKAQNRLLQKIHYLNMVPGVF